MQPYELSDSRVHTPEVIRAGRFALHLIGAEEVWPPLQRSRLPQCPAALALNASLASSAEKGLAVQVKVGKIIREAIRLEQMACGLFQTPGAVQHGSSDAQYAFGGPA
jgi:hypothetical protein